MFVTERFTLAGDTLALLRSLRPNFGYGGFGALTYYRTYSRQQYRYDVVDRATGDVLQADFAEQFLATRWLEQMARKSLTTDSPVNPDRFKVQERVTGQEHWADTVIRNIEGCFSIRKDWMVKQHLDWNEPAMQALAREMALSMFDMHWCPPGRGLWAMGTEFIYQRGGMALNNCGFTALGDDFFADLHWLMDALMLGVGIGFEPIRNDALKLYEPKGTYSFEVPDTREGWCDLIRATGEAFLYDRNLPIPDTSKIRKEGEPIRGFGGVASGPGPLLELYNRVITLCRWYMQGFVEHKGKKIPYDSLMLKADLANCTGVCVVAGNVRRSAELMAGRMSDKVFLNLKDYNIYPYRKPWGWMSNNSVKLADHDDFDQLGEIARRVIERGDPGYINERNMPFGRIGKINEVAEFGIRPDRARAFNPCGEQPEEDKELCNVVDTAPTRAMHADPEIAGMLGSKAPIDNWLRACRHATFYASTVSLLLTHRPETNAVIARNRRIGVGLIDFTGWKAENSTRQVTRWMRDGYRLVRETNRLTNEEAGVPAAIRVTTVKPGGTTTKLIGRQPGIGYPNFQYMIRRINVHRLGPDGQGNMFHRLLVEAGIPYEASRYTPETTDVFEFPVPPQSNVKTALEVSIWEQAANLCLVQREWADNAVSNTLNFRPRWYVVEKVEETPLPATVFTPDGRKHRTDKLKSTIQDRLREKDLTEYRVTLEDELGQDVVKVYKFDPQHEEDDLEAVLAHIAPLTKSVALLPQSPVGTHPQMPEEGITKEECERRAAAIKPIDWTRLKGVDGEDEKFCGGDKCVVNLAAPVKGKRLQPT